MVNKGERVAETMRFGDIGPGIERLIVEYHAANGSVFWGGKFKSDTNMRLTVLNSLRDDLAEMPRCKRSLG